MATKQVRFNLVEENNTNVLDNNRIEFARIPEPAKQIASIQFSLLRA